jgi:predicted transcriptional regulator
MIVNWGEIKIMKSDSLLIYVMSSGVRKGLVNLLGEPRSLKELRERLGMPSSNVIPEIKGLESKNLVDMYDGRYGLTSTGEILANMAGMADSIDVLLERHGRFLNGRDLKPIPDSLLLGIGALAGSRLVKNGLEDVNATDRVLFDSLKGAGSFVGISPFFNMYYPEFFLSMARRGVPVSIILTGRVYEKVKNEYPDALQAYLELDNAGMYVIEDARLALAVADSFLALSLPFRDGPPDAQSCLVCFKGKHTSGRSFKYSRRQLPIILSQKL